MKLNNTLQAIIELAQQNADIAIVWLYGSRAKGTANINSDYDLAVAFKTFIKDDPLEKRLRPECLALDWQRALGLHDFQLSIVDINQVPIPLAWEIIEPDCVLYCGDESRLWQETQRIQSRMELDFTRPIHKYPLQLWN
jgi:predicted nucleotidyltransferase